jgi:hypothetical protein
VPNSHDTTPTAVDTATASVQRQVQFIPTNGPSPKPRLIRVMDLSILHYPSAAEDHPNQCELDSHADTCNTGQNTVSLHFTDHKITGSQLRKKTVTQGK